VPASSSLNHMVSSRGPHRCLRPHRLHDDATRHRVGDLVVSGGVGDLVPPGGFGDLVRPGRFGNLVPSRGVGDLVEDAREAPARTLNFSDLRSARPR
jgi:hypothetical protein